jgi:hypothetical protein
MGVGPVTAAAACVFLRHVACLLHAWACVVQDQWLQQQPDWLALPEPDREDLRAALRFEPVNYNSQVG